MARIPIRDRRTQRLRPIATPSQGQPEIAPETLVGEALQQAAQLAMQGQKIKQHFETIRLQEAYNQYVAESEREFQNLQQLRGYAPLDTEGYTASLRRLQEFRENQISELPAHLRRKYELMLANRVTKDTIRFRGYALSEAEKAAAQTAEVAEAQVVEDAAKVTTFEDVESLIQHLDYYEDPETGEKTPGAVRSLLIMQGAPQEAIEYHFKGLRGRAHLSSVNGQLAAARERSDITLFDQARDHLEKAKDFLSPDVYNKLKDRIDNERVIVAAQKAYENLLVLATHDSPDADAAQLVDEHKLAKLISELPAEIRGLVQKIAKEYAPLRQKVRDGVVNRYYNQVVQTFWDTRSVTITENSAAMQWLKRNDPDTWREAKEYIENWARKRRSEARAIRSAQRAEERYQRSLQYSAVNDPENIRLLYELREDMLLNPLKYAAEDYDVDALSREWGLRIPGPLHNQMYESFEKFKRWYAQNENRIALDRFRSYLKSRAGNFADANERREFTAAMWSLYEQALSAGKPLTTEDVDRIINRAETQVKTKGFIFTSEKPYVEALMRGDTIISYYDPSTNQWIEGAPPPGVAIRVYNRDGEVEEDIPAAPATTIDPLEAEARRLRGWGPNDPVDPKALEKAKLEVRARRRLGLGPNDPVDQEDLEEAMRILKQLDEEEARRAD